jgi:hypothetical protein
MSDKKRISSLRALLKRGKNAARENGGWFEDLELHSAIGDALIDIGKDGIYELTDEVYLYLDDPFSDFRAEAVKTLGWNTRLGIDEFCKSRAFKIWEQDPDEDVKRVALAAWSNYYARTKNKDVLKILYDIVILKEYSCIIRAWALHGLLNVSDRFARPGKGHEILAMGDLDDNEKFNKAVDWNRINCIMTECVPGWEEKIKK